MIYSIFATDINLLLGDKNILPWHYKKDLQYYKEIVNNKDVLMGYNTYLSLRKYYKENTKLPYNKIYIASLDKNIKYNNLDNVDIVLDIDKFLNDFKNDLYIVGGKTIYELTFKYCDILYITFILNTHIGDTYLNKLDLSSFELTSSKLDNNLVFTKYERRTK